MTESNRTASARIALRLHDIGAVKFGDFTLKSGAWSPVYLDLRLLVSDPPLLVAAAHAYAGVLAALTYDRIAAIPYAAMPIGTAIAIETGEPMIYPRKEVKAHGTGQSIEGTFKSGETAVVVDDVISSGKSKLEAIQPLEAAGLVVHDVVVLVDREAAGSADLEAAGYALHSVMTLIEIADALAEAGRLSPDQLAVVKEYVESTRAGS